MSLNATIAIKLTSQKYLSIYCHFYNAVENTGAILSQYYNTKRRIKKLLALGDISILGPRLISAAGGTVAYCRDKSYAKHDVQSKASMDTDDFESQQYIFDKGQWYFSGYETDYELVSLSDQLLIS